VFGRSIAAPVRAMTRSERLRVAIVETLAPGSGVLRLKCLWDLCLNLAVFCWGFVLWDFGMSVGVVEKTDASSTAAPTARL
jgi:hypothetical protein